MQAHRFVPNWLKLMAARGVFLKRRELLASNITLLPRSMRRTCHRADQCRRFLHAWSVEFSAVAIEQRMGGYINDVGW